MVWIGVDCCFGLLAANTFIVIPLLLLGMGMLLVPVGNLGLTILLLYPIYELWLDLTFMPWLLLIAIFLVPIEILFWPLTLALDFLLDFFTLPLLAASILYLSVLFLLSFLVPISVPLIFLLPFLALMFIPIDLFVKALVALVAWPITMWIPGQLPFYLL